MTLEKLIALAAERFDKDVSQLNGNTTFDELNIDSLDMVELIMLIEEEFDVVISDDDVENLTTLGDVAEYIDKV